MVRTSSHARRSVEVPAFVDSIYQWAATLSQSGANYPTALPLKVDKLANGFQVMCGERLWAGWGWVRFV